MSDCMDDYDDRCDVCGAHLVGGEPETGGCPSCLPCGGVYSAGTEECEFCEWSDSCSADYVAMIERRPLEDEEVE